MALKLVLFSCLLTLAHCSVGPVAFAAAPAGPVAYTPARALARFEEYDPLPQYRFGYNVADTLTGDYKSQQEQRDGDTVQGSYSVVEPDGTRRVVDYVADSVNGFNAVVRHESLVAAVPAGVVSAAPTPVTAEPVLAARYAYAPQVAVATPSVYARYVVAGPYMAQDTGTPTAAGSVFPYYAYAPLRATQVAARAATPVAARYVTAPVAARYITAPPAPLTARYAGPVATTHQFPEAASFAAAAGPARLAASSIAPAVPVATFTRAAVRAATARLVEPVATAGYRYP